MTFLEKWILSTTTPKFRVGVCLRLLYTLYIYNAPTPDVTANSVEIVLGLFFHCEVVTNEQRVHVGNNHNICKCTCDLYNCEEGHMNKFAQSHGGIIL